MLRPAASADMIDDMTVIPFARDAFRTAPVTRFAPSPNGRLHLGHAYSALMTHDVAGLSPEGRYSVRIEDIDGTRSRPDHVDAICADLSWLGLAGAAPMLFQSSRVAHYRAALDRLRDEGLLYRCFCTRGDIKAALRKTSVRHGPDGPIYPGTCRRLDEAMVQDRLERGEPFAWRIKTDVALQKVGTLDWQEAGHGSVTADPAIFGDVVLWRKDSPASYHLAVVIDDAFQAIDPVVRGLDLFAYTGLHRLLQTLLDLPEPHYWHHPLLLGSDGEKLAKSAGSPTLEALRQSGMRPETLIDALRKGQMPSGISLSMA